MISGLTVLQKNGLINPRLCLILLLIRSWRLIFIQNISMRLKSLLNLISRVKLFSTFISGSSITNVDDEAYTDFFLSYEPDEVNIDEYYNNCSYSDLDCS